MKIGKFTIRFHSPLTFEVEGRYMRKVKKALREGKTFEAIKLYRDSTGKPLRECRDYVVEVLKPKYYKEFKKYSFGIWEYLPLSWGILHFLNQGKCLSAIVLYKNRMNSSLDESKKVIDDIQEKIMNKNDNGSTEEV